MGARLTMSGVAHRVCPSSVSLSMGWHMGIYLCRVGIGMLNGVESTLQGPNNSPKAKSTCLGTPDGALGAWWGLGIPSGMGCMLYGD